jgi:hypothetical protein
VQSLAESLDDLLSHPMEAASLGLEGQKRVLERHDQRVLAERLGHWISEIGQIPEETRRATGISVRVPRPAELRPEEESRRPQSKRCSDQSSSQRSELSAPVR